MASPLALKEMTAHIRRRVAIAGIKARVRMSPAGGALQIFPPSYEARFTNDEQRTLMSIIEANRLRGARQLPLSRETPRPSGFEHLEQELPR